MSEEKRIEDMRAELTAAGCHIYQAGFVGNHPFWVCECPDSVSPENGDYSNHKEFVLRKAYARLQREKRYAAMEAFVREVAGDKWDERTRNGYPELGRAASHLDSFRHKAKALLGEGVEE
jgi:hypothetical protein